MRRKPPRNARWSEERDAYLLVEYPVNTPMPKLLTTLNAMPGPPVNIAQVQDRAVKNLGVRRSGIPPPKAPTPILLETAPWQPVKLRPLARLTRDNFVSRAWMDSEETDATVPVSMDDIKLWASQHAREALKAADMVGEVNATRIRFGLPPFRVVKLKQGRLPPAWFGSDSQRPHEEKSPAGDNGD